MSFPTKDERKKCYLARDEFWKCLTKHNVTDDSVPEECKKLRHTYELGCPATWVTHFDRKRLYEQFKAKMNQGYDPLEQPK